MKKIMLILMLPAVVLAVSGCSGLVKNSYRALVVASEAYEVSMKSAAEAEASGAITAEQRAEINEAAQVYYNAYQKAVDALEAYVVSESETDEEKAREALHTATAAIADLLKIVADYTGKEPEDE